MANEFLPHIASDKDVDTLPKKTFMFAGYVTKMLMVHFGMLDVDDRDEHVNKRIESSGSLLSFQFYQCLRMALVGISYPFRYIIAHHLWQDSFNAHQGQEW